MEKQHGKIEWPQEAVLELVKMWETNKCLYNPKHKFYHNKHARYAALNQMADELKVFDPAIGATEIKNKLQCLRGQYTHELAKAKERKSGAGAKDEYIPVLSFLHDYVQIRKGGCNLYDGISGRSEESLDSSSFDSETSPAKPSKRPRVSRETPQTSRGMTLEQSFLAAATSVLEKIASNIPSVPKGNEKVKNLCNYIQSELNDITNLEERNELMDSLTTVIIQSRYKRRMAK